MTGRTVVLMILLFSTWSAAIGGELQKYYNQMGPIDGKAGWCSDLHRDSELKVGPNRKLRIYLVVGNLFDFLGSRPANVTGSSLHVDAMVMSTNVDLDFETNNPTIQAAFRKQLPANIKSDIHGAFQKHGKLSDFRDAVVVQFPADYSPRMVAFVATDLKQGGTGESDTAATKQQQEWVTTELSRERIGKRIENSLRESSKSGAKTVVTPLIGASKVDYATIDRPGAFIEDVAKRLEMRKRMEKSIEGILHGVKTYIATASEPESTVEEFCILLRADDIKQLVSEREQKSPDLRKQAIPGGYRTLKGQFLNAFDSGIKEIADALGHSQ